MPRPRRRRPANEDVEFLKPPMSFCRAIGLRRTVDPDTIATPAKFKVVKGPNGGYNKLWQTAEDRNHIAEDFVLGLPEIRKCTLCNATVLHSSEYRLCCAAGKQRINDEDWPEVTADYRRTAIECRGMDREFHRSCISINRWLATAKIVVDSVAPDHADSLYKPFGGGWNIRQAGNVVLAGRSYLVPLERNRMNAVYLNTSMNGQSPLNIDEFVVMMVVDAIEKEKEVFSSTSYFLTYQPQPGDFPAISLPRSSEMLPPDDYRVVFAEEATDVNRMAEAVSLTTVGPNHYSAPHMSVARQQPVPLASAPACGNTRTKKFLAPLEHCDPHAYPILLPLGIGGYSTRAKFINSTGRKPLLLRDFMKRVLYQRGNDLALFPRVTELMMLDQCNRIAAVLIDQMVNIDQVREGYRKRVARMNEYRLHSDSEHVGRNWQFPHTMPGAPAYIKRKLNDGMALIAKFGDPSLFITMTTNKNWPEVTELLKRSGVPDDPPEAHPLFTVRAFRMRLQALEATLRDGTAFGVQMDYLQRCVEFQMRGLSHAHIIVRLKGEQPLSSSNVGKFVSARLFYDEWCPNFLPREDSECQCFAHKLTRLVSKFMVHKCMVGVCKKTKNDVCSKRFPFAPTDVNYISEDTGRWFYKRSPTDAYVVPYNPILLYLFECHLNVDCCTGPGSGRYIRKYQCKMADSTLMRLDRFDNLAPGQQQRPRDQGGGQGDDFVKTLLRKELMEFFRVRVMSSSEAATRLLDINIHKLEPPVKCIYIHLPGDHIVSLDQQAENADGVSTDATSITGSMLLRYFQRPRGPAYDNLTIIDYFSQYDLDIRSDNNVTITESTILDQGMQNAPFFLRKCRPTPVTKRPVQACGYVMSVHPAKPELYCLRQLLVTRPARSFVELQAGFQTFQAAAEAAGLFCFDKEQQTALQTCINHTLSNKKWLKLHDDRKLATPLATGYRVLNLFVSLITTTDDKQSGGTDRKTTISALFDMFWPYLLPQLPHSRQDDSPFDNASKRDEALRHVSEKLHPLRIEMEDVGLPLPANDGFPGSSPWETVVLSRERARYTRDALEAECSSTNLTDEQKSWIQQVQQHLHSPEGSNNVFFLGGNAGSGKSTAIRHLLAKVRLDGAIALPAAFMAAAASILPGGDTLHRLFKLPVESDSETSETAMKSTIKGQTSAFAILKHAKLIVIDEISMVSSRILQCVHDTLCEVRGSSKDVPFGGVCVVLGGDFKQLTPVIKRATCLSTVTGSVTSMKLFRDARKTFFRKQLRLLDVEWNRVSLATGYGVPCFRPCPTCSTRRSNLPSPMPPFDCPVCLGLDFITSSPDDHADNDDTEYDPVKNGFFTLDVDYLLRHKLIPSACAITTSNEEARRFAGDDGYIISPLNVDVVSHNDSHVPHVYDELLAVNTQDKPADDPARQASFRNISQEIMDAYNGSGIPPSHLKLWVGARVTLLRNLNPSIGLYNGQHLIVRSISKFLIQVSITDIAGRYNSDTIHDIPRVSLSGTVCCQQFSRKQFPLKLAYAMTVNRSQGQTIRNRRVVIDATRDYFSHGHLYVALTRVQEASQVMLLISPDSRALSSVVYQTILENSGDTARVHSSTVPLAPAVVHDADVPTLLHDTELPLDAEHLESVDDLFQIDNFFDP